MAAQAAAQPSHLVDAVVSVALQGRVLAVLAALDAPDHAHRLPRAPVLGLGALLVIDGRAAVQGQRSAGHTRGAATAEHGAGDRPHHLGGPAVSLGWYYCVTSV